jgi:DNA-binding transcriptional regulator YiaG
MNDRAKQFKALRLAAGLSQPKAAELIGFKKRAIQYWEAGVNPIPQAAWELFQIKVDLLLEQRRKENER